MKTKPTIASISCSNLLLVLLIGTLVSVESSFFYSTSTANSRIAHSRRLTTSITEPVSFSTTTLRWFGKQHPNEDHQEDKLHYRHRFRRSTFIYKQNIFTRMMMVEEERSNNDHPPNGGHYAHHPVTHNQQYNNSHQQQQQQQRRNDSDMMMTTSSTNATAAPFDNTNPPAPIYITIGPQCCGKTTLLQCLSPELIDISLDDQRDVYIPIPTQAYLLDHPTNHGMNTTEFQHILETRYHDKTMKERIYSNDNLEIRLILQRWAGLVSPQQFAVRLLQHYQQLELKHNNTNQRQNNNKFQNNNINKNTDKMLLTHVGKTLIHTVESYLSNPGNTTTLPTSTSLFCFESLVRQHPQTNTTGIEQAIQSLKYHAKHTPTYPIAWGNTNSKARDYQQVLEIAADCNRPIEFVLYETKEKQQAYAARGGGMNIPRASLQQLLMRNILRYVRTGKYIPANTIYACQERVDTLLAQAITLTARYRASSNINVAGAIPYSSWNIDCALTQLVPTRTDYCYAMTANRTVKKELKQNYGSMFKHNNNRPFQQNNNNNNNYYNKHGNDDDDYSNRQHFAKRHKRF